jgi:transcriptional regulator
MNLKGSLPLLILNNLKSGPNHGYRIAKQIKQQSEGVLDFKEGTLYPTLHGLEKQGLIEAYQEIENGRKRRYYRLTEAGRAALSEEMSEWEEYTHAVNRILKGATTS